MRARQILEARVAKTPVAPTTMGSPTSTPVNVSPQDKLAFIKTKLSKNEVNDPKTIDFIFKILNKPQIQQAVQGLLGNIQVKDQDVAGFQKLNNNILSKIIRKMPVEKEQLDAFLTKWDSEEGLVNTSLMVPGNKGTIQELIPDPVAFQAFELFESIRASYKMPKKGTSGYGEFGLSLLSTRVAMKAPGDIEVDGNPIEVKGNDARLYADERTAAVSEGAAPKQPSVRGAAPGLLNNVMTNLLSQDAAVRQETANQAIAAFKQRGVSNGRNIISAARAAGYDQGLRILQTEWWKAGFNSYQKAIQMPIMVIGFGQFLISDNAEDFVQWGCLPRTPSNYGYMFGRAVGQTRETYPKIFVPGHNK
jgi:hypothetical protein